MDIKHPSLDDQLAAMERIARGAVEQIEHAIEKAREDVRTASRALATVDGTGIVAAASHCWVQEMDYTQVSEDWQSVTARLDVSNAMGHRDGICRVDARQGVTTIKRGRYRAVLCLIPLPDEAA